jgi:hypothetical protein
VSVERCVAAVTLGHCHDVDLLDVIVELSDIGCGDQHKFVHSLVPLFKVKANDFTPEEWSLYTVWSLCSK